MNPPPAQYPRSHDVASKRRLPTPMLYDPERVRVACFAAIMTYCPSLIRVCGAAMTRSWIMGRWETLLSALKHNPAEESALCRRTRMRI